MSFQVESGVHEYKRTYSNYRFIPIQHYKKMQVICLSSLLFLLGFSHAEIAMSPTDTAISTINKAAQLASTMKTTDTRARRSVNLRRLSTEEFNQCQTIASRVACETGLQEDLYTLALECQQQDTANQAQFACGVNENGLYCSQGLDISKQFFKEAFSNCRSFSSCSSSCRNSITRIRDQLGCCSGHWTNLFAGSRTNFDGALWSVCGVSTGELCPIPDYNSTVTSRFCTKAETSRILFSRRCMLNTSGITVKTLANTTGCEGVAKIHVEACSVLFNGDFCALKTSQGRISTLVQNCAQSLVSGNACSFSCKASLITLHSVFGCCINSLFNGTTTKIAPISGSEELLRYFTNSFWSKCNVAPPGMCENPLLLPEINNEDVTTSEPNGGIKTSETNGGVKTSGVISVMLIVALALFLF